MLETKSYNNQDQFLDEIDRVSGLTLPWEKTPIFDVNFAVNKSGDEKVFVTKSGSFPIRECAFRSLRQRLRSEGSTLFNHVCGSNDPLDNKLFVEYTEWAKNAMKRMLVPNNDVKISIVDGKANAFMSDEYVECLNTAYVHNEAFQKIIETSGQEEFAFSGWFSYALSQARYETNVEKEVSGKKYGKCFSVRTSDAGYSSIAISIDLAAKGFILPMMSDITIQHRSRKKADDLEIKADFKAAFAEALNKAEKVFGENVKKAEEMAKYTTKMPKDFILNLGKELGIPTKDVSNKVKYHLSSASTSTINLFDVFEMLSFTVDDMTNIEQRIKYKGNVTKMLGIDWSNPKNIAKYEKPFKEK